MACNLKNSPSSSCNVMEKTCIEVDKVFDVCKSQTTMDNVYLTVDFPVGTNPVSVLSITSGTPSEISNLVVFPLSDSCCSRVRYTIEIPITIVAQDALGNQIVGSSSVSLEKDLIMSVPVAESMVPYTISADGFLAGAQSAITATDTVMTNLCITVITKVTAKVILVIPSYGYRCIPICRELVQDVCDGLFRRPIYPSTGCGGR